MDDAIQDNAQVQWDGTDGKTGHGNTKSLVNLPTELLVKVLSYLPIHDKINMTQYVCRRFQGLGEVPLVWKEFVGPYEPHHVSSVHKVLKAYGEHVRQIFFPAHVIPTKILEMVQCCTKVTHLTLPRDTQLSLDHLQEIMLIMTHLQELNMFAHGNFIKKNVPGKFIEGLLKVSAANVRVLTLHIDDLRSVVASIQGWADQGYPLPSIINIYSEIRTLVLTNHLFTFWSTSSSKLPPFEITFYANKVEGVPLNLYPPVPQKKFQFGPTATPPFIRLSDHGIVGLKHDIFHLCDYDHHGTVRYAVTPDRDVDVHYEERHFHYTSHLHSVAYVDVSHRNILSDHLKQLVIVCPNLQRLNLQGNSHCLKRLEGLRAIVHTCQNLEILNLAEILLSRVESYLLLWELLSSLKKLTYLTIDQCMLKLYDPDDANKQKLISMFNGCCSLQALEIHCGQRLGCRKCKSNADFLFSHFPSLTHLTMNDFQCSGIAYAISNCYQLKYLYEYRAQRTVFPLSNNCHLQQLSIASLYFQVCDKLAEALSVHGELECVTIHVNSITINAITTIINNSPNLISLNIHSKGSPFKFEDEVCRRGPQDHTDRVRMMFPWHKLFLIGSAYIFSAV